MPGPLPCTLDRAMPARRAILSVWPPSGTSPEWEIAWLSGRWPAVAARITPVERATSGYLGNPEMDWIPGRRAETVEVCPRRHPAYGSESAGLPWLARFACRPRSAPPRPELAGVP